MFAQVASVLLIHGTWCSILDCSHDIALTEDTLCSVTWLAQVRPFYFTRTLVLLEVLSILWYMFHNIAENSYVLFLSW